MPNPISRRASIARSRRKKKVRTASRKADSGIDFTPDRDTKFSNAIPLPSLWLAEWLAWDVLYRISVGTVLGLCIGWLLGRILAMPAWNTVAASGPGVLVLAGVFLAYGLVELAEGYGFIAAFVAGLMCRRAEARHRFHQRLHAFASSIEHAITAILLVLLGSVMPSLWPHLDWSHTIIGFGLILVIRPIAGMLGLYGSSLGLKARGVVAIYGVRGIGSLYYLGYAATHLKFIDEGPLWALVAFTIFASTVIHGLTATAMVEVLDREYAEGGGTGPDPVVETDPALKN